jgi:hypothetical protein
MTMSCPRAVAHPVIGRHRLGRCLHIFTMATELKRDREIPLNFKPGTILTLKPTPVSRAPADYDYALELCNKKSDTLLQIDFSTGGIVLNDCAHRSLGDGWGEPQTVDMTQVDLKGRSVLQVTISIYHYLTESEFGRYQILFNGTTIAHFETRFPGPAKEIGYWVDIPGGPRSWDVDVYKIDDLLPEEQLALGPGR